MGWWLGGWSWSIVDAFELLMHQRVLGRSSLFSEYRNASSRATRSAFYSSASESCDCAIASVCQWRALTTVTCDVNERLDKDTCHFFTRQVPNIELLIYYDLRSGNIASSSGECLNREIALDCNCCELLNLKQIPPSIHFVFATYLRYHSLTHLN